MVSGGPVAAATASQVSPATAAPTPRGSDSCEGEGPPPPALFLAPRGKAKVRNSPGSSWDTGRQCPIKGCRESDGKGAAGVEEGEPGW